MTSADPVLTLRSLVRACRRNPLRAAPPAGAPLLACAQSPHPPNARQSRALPTGTRWGWGLNASAPTPLPIPLDSRERKLPLAVGPDADDAAARADICLKVTGGPGPIWVRLNHHLLEPPQPRGQLLTVGVPPGVLRRDANELALWTDRSLLSNDSPTIVHQVLCRMRC